MASSAQPELFVFEDSVSVGSVELFPAVWQAAEQLVAANPQTRQLGLAELLRLDAARFSPLVAYLLATRLGDADLELRCQVMRTLADVLSADAEGRPAPEAVRAHLMAYLAQIDEYTFRAMLQAGAEQPDLFRPLSRLLNLCPAAGAHLSAVLPDRGLSLETRQLAVQLIGQVGFMDAYPELKRLHDRLLNRQNGQQAMPFAPPALAEEIDLLPTIKAAMRLLKSE